MLANGACFCVNECSLKACVWHSELQTPPWSFLVYHKFHCRSRNVCGAGITTQKNKVHAVEMQANLTNSWKAIGDGQYVTLLELYPLCLWKKFLIVVALEQGRFLHKHLCSCGNETCMQSCTAYIGSYPCCWSNYTVSILLTRLITGVPLQRCVNGRQVTFAHLHHLKTISR